MTDATEQPLVRQATGEDLQAVLDVGHRTWPVTYGPIAGDDYVEMGVTKWWTADNTIPAIRAGRVNVAELDGTVVGMSSVGTQDSELYLWKLYVLPEFQKRGVGGALMRAVLKSAAAEGYSQLNLSYLDGNDSAAAFYTSFGFVFVERESGGSGIPDSIWVSKSLGATT